ncbi:hypothetical protein J2Y49_003430 [Azospirillum sp. BE72]|nr:hypothetical protein [Azospirillum sp. BE72]
MLGTNAADPAYRVEGGVNMPTDATRDFPRTPKLRRDNVHAVEQRKRRDPEVYAVGELPADLVADIEAAKYGAGPHAHRLTNTDDTV